jgi:hypothetical protein
MSKRIAEIRKALVAAFGAGLIVAAQGYADGRMTPDEWGAVAASVVVGLATWAIPNRSPSQPG